MCGVAGFVGGVPPSPPSDWIKSYHVNQIVDHVAALLREPRTPELEARVMVTLNGLCKDWRAGDAERWEGC